MKSITPNAIGPLPSLLVETAVRAALLEDLGLAGDITTTATVPENAKARAEIRARAPGIVAGVQFVSSAFANIDPSINVEVSCSDAASVEPGTVIARITGPARPILTAERVALNFLGRLSGVATATHQLVERVRGSNAKIVCTRKTTPGLRPFEKFAVRCGGGFNHRFGLSDGILIKDNHIIAAKGVTAAIKAAQRAAGHMVHIEIEVDSLSQLDEAILAGANTILLDNMSLDMLRQAVQITRGRAKLEASGNINMDTVADVASTGVDLISSGAITHSAKCLDLGLDFLQA